MWTLLNTMMQGQSTRDQVRKLLSINEGQKYLLKRMIQLSKGPRELLSDPTNIPNTISLNYVPVPTGFVALERVWRRNGTNYTMLGPESVITYDDLLLRLGEIFFQTANTGAFNLAGLKEPNLYLDTHFANTFTTSETITGATSGATGTVTSVSGTTLTYASVAGSFSNAEVIEGTTSGTQATISSVAATTMTIAITGGTKEIKISYWKLPTAMVNYDSLAITSPSGSFTVGETITGGTSNASGTLYLDNTTTLFLQNIVGTFSSSETVTGSSSAETATTTALISPKPQTLDYNDNHELLVAQAAVVMWHKFKNSAQIAEESEILDNLIEQNSDVEIGRESASWSLA